MSDVQKALELAEHIRKVNGNNRMGAAALAESIIEWQAARAGGDWVIQLVGDYRMTRGNWERPDHRGYTNELHEAGRYSEAEAKHTERMRPDKYKAVQLPQAHPPAKVPEWKGKDHGPEYDHSIHTNPDAKAWADFFMATSQNCGVDHATMHGWFANAMMAMYDHLQNTNSPTQEGE